MEAPAAAIAQRFLPTPNRLAPKECPSSPSALNPAYKNFDFNIPGYRAGGL